MIYDILKYPDPRLKIIASEIKNDEFNQDLFNIVRNMYETMYAMDGVGLAATQVDIHKQIIVTNVDETERTFINPTIFFLNDETKKFTEGCLSFPGVKIEKERPKNVSLEYREVDGTFKQIHCDGLLAVCVQHEIDHLTGSLFIDDLGEFKKQRILQKYFKT